MCIAEIQLPIVPGRVTSPWSGLLVRQITTFGLEIHVHAVSVR